jgi:hypothetical protein
MLLYALTTKTRTWVLDLTRPPDGPVETRAPSVYALVVPAAPVAVYIGSTKNLAARIRQHLSRSRALLSRGRGPHCLPRTAAAAVLSRVIAGRSGLLVIRLEAVPPGDETLLRRLELAWLIVAAREELPEPRRRGPRIQWSGDPGELRKAFRLARKRHWPGLWIRALKPLCDHRALPDPRLARPPQTGPAGRPSRRGAAS